MSTDQRNFRSAYLEKVGIKGVEEKKSIEILLKEQPLDISKLVQFTLRFPVPNIHRPFVWKVLLGVLPPHQSSHEFVSQQRQEQYDDLHEALVAMRRIQADTPLPHVHLKMFLIEEDILPFEEEKMMKVSEHQDFLAIGLAMLEVVDEPVDLYWLTCNFYRAQDKFKDSIPVMKEKFDHYLKKEDGDGKLYNHLSRLRAFHHLPLTRWFSCCFAGVLPDTSFERIWDKVVGGSCKILVYVAVSIMLTFKRPILSMENMDNVNKYLTKIPEDSGDIIESKAIEIWQKYGSLLMPGALKADSPSLVERPAS